MDKFVANIAYISIRKSGFVRPLGCCLTVHHLSTVSLADKRGTKVERRVKVAKECLRRILSSFGHPDLARALSLLPHLTKNQTVRRRIIVADEVILALVDALESSTKTPRGNTMVVDSICQLLQTKDGACASFHLRYMLIAGIVELRDKLVARLTDETSPNGHRVLSSLLRLLETNGNLVCWSWTPLTCIV